MSKATKFKYVAKEVLEEYPEPDAEHPVMKVLSSLGNNLHEVESPKGEKFLVSMPMKFRRNVWIKKGDYVIIEWVDAITKVQGDILHILYTDQIRHLKQNNMWPPEFEDDKTQERGDRGASRSVQKEAAQAEGAGDGDEGESDSESDSDGEEIFVNRNRQQRYMESESDSGSESDVEDEDEPDEEESARSEA